MIAGKLVLEVKLVKVYRPCGVERKQAGNHVATVETLSENVEIK